MWAPVLDKTTSVYWQVTSYGNSMWLCECEDVLRKHPPGIRPGREKGPVGAVQTQRMSGRRTDAIPEGDKHRAHRAAW